MPSLVLSVLAALTLLDISSAIPATLSQTQSYDYVIVGGGACGLVVANRLSEFANVTVAVIEAGDDVRNNVNVTSVDGYGLAFGTAIDYAFQTVDQTYANNASAVLRAAKAIGGTTTINGMAYTRAPITQMNSWETVGNEGWNWDNLWPYYLKHENFQVPADWQLADGADFIAANHGSGGPVKTGWVDGIINSTIFESWNDTHTAMNIPYNVDVNGGSMIGFSWHPKFIDQTANIRVDAGNAYYWPISNRSNLHMYSNTHAEKILWNSTEGTVVAGGVEVTAADGTVSTIYANKEVILSAGSLRSPIILELSGVGNPDVLAKHDIDVIVNLPTVGENLQDQINNQMYYNTKTNFTGIDSFVTYPTAAQVFGSNYTTYAQAIQSSLATYAATVSTASNNVTKAADLLQFFQLQYDLIFNSSNPVPVAEIYTTALNSEFDLEYWGLLPFSRGSIHINSNVSTAPALINPNYFMLDWDLDVQVETGKFIREGLAKKEPIVSMISEQTAPTLDTLPTNAPLSTWTTYLKSTYRPNYHPVGTAAMMPASVGGVVSPSLKVYGVENLRVIDASVLPFQVCGHLTSTLYAVAERAADIVKAEM